MDSNLIHEPSVRKIARPDLGEIGRTGLKVNAGMVDEEILRVLRGPQQFKAYREMSDNSAIVGAVLFAMEQLILGVSWDVVPFAEENADEENAEQIRTMLFEDMSASWAATLSEILTFFIFGFSFFEVRYKIRGGESRDPTRNSKYTDGLIGLRKLAPRSQESLWQWEFDEEGGIQAFVQQAAPSYQLRPIPIEKGLLFRTKLAKGNPQGRSLLRNAYTSWYRQNHIMNIEGIGIERDLQGFPVMYVPPSVANAQPGTPESAAFSAYQDLVTNVRRDEMEGVILPAVFDDNGNRLYELMLLTSGGRRQFDTNQIIMRYDTRIAMTVLADFILLGQDAVGSRALSTDKTEIFTMSLAGYMDSIAEVINAHLIPRLFRFNGKPTNRLPKITHGKVAKVNLADFGMYISQLAGAGMPLFPNPGLEEFVAELGGFPPPPVTEEGEL